MKEVTFGEIIGDFVTIAHEQVWCTAATVDTRNRPRSRVLHPIWELAGEDATGWICTGRHTVKEKHLQHSPYMSLSYGKDPFRPAVAECHAAWVDDPAEKARIWAWFKSVPQPLGYDPGLIWKAPDHEDFGVLCLKPWSITMGILGGEWRMWRE